MPADPAPDKSLTHHPTAAQNADMIEARHAGHHHSTAHAHVGLLFFGALLLVMAMYSLCAFVYSKHYAARPFGWPCPRWAVVATWTLLCVAAFLRSRDWDSLAWWARRFGRIGLAVAVFSQFLVLKPAPLPRTYVTALTSCHKWAGRTAVGMALMHGMLYSIAYAQHSQLYKLYTERDNLWGIFALSAYVAMAILSLKFVRRRWYFLFYTPHVPLAALAMALIVFHARPSAAHIVEVSSALGLLSLALKFFTTRSAAATVMTVSPAYDVVVLERKAMPLQFQAGTYLRLSPTLWKPTAWLGASHPYTVASLDSDSDVKLVVRRTRWQVQSTNTYACQGPFNVPFDVFSYKTVLAVGGGAGISFVAPLWRQALNSKDTRVAPIWITRSVQDLDVLGHIGLTECSVYITGEEKPLEPTEDAFELDDMDSAQLLPKAAELSDLIMRFSGRPDFDALKLEGEDVAVVACGPETLIADLRKWAAAKGHAFFAEQYST